MSPPAWLLTVELARQRAVRIVGQTVAQAVDGEAAARLVDSITLALADALHNGGHAVADHYRGHAQSTDNYSCAVALGRTGMAETTGVCGHAVTTYRDGYSRTYGACSHAIALGPGGAASVGHSSGIAMSVHGAVRGMRGSWLICTEMSPDGSIGSIHAQRCGDGGPPPDTWVKYFRGAWHAVNPPERTQDREW